MATNTARTGEPTTNKAFFDYRNNLFAQQAKGVIDVSSWQGDIDWAKAKADGVEGAIIRLGLWMGQLTPMPKRNVTSMNANGLVFRLASTGTRMRTMRTVQAEGNDVVSKLRQMGVRPNDLKYPVYYDLESWTWTGHTPPNDPNVYNGIVDAWYGALQSGGYKNLGVYSYTSYLQGPLNNSNIYAKTRWVAQYGAADGIQRRWDQRSWLAVHQCGRINGISGSVDMNAFGNKNYVQKILSRHLMCAR